MPAGKIAKYIKSAKLSKPDQPCPFRRRGSYSPLCNKRGGVCSVRLYRCQEDGSALPHERKLVTLCPQRFWEGDLVFKQISGSILNCPKPIMVKEVGFLKGENAAEVGRIDSVLVVPNSFPLHWCSVEIQAVYFSGQKMGLEFEMLSNSRDNKIPFPSAIRRPDFRSSGPKRLMPQLQIKVPTLRRWGKKMAVVVDDVFFNSMGKMEATSDLSNADIAWFIVDYKINRSRSELFVAGTRYTTLELAINGLTAGLPVTLSEFEEEILRRIAAGIKIL